MKASIAGSPVVFTQVPNSNNLAPPPGGGGFNQQNPFLLDVKSQVISSNNVSTVSCYGGSNNISWYMDVQPQSTTVTGVSNDVVAVQPELLIMKNYMNPFTNRNTPNVCVIDFINKWVWVLIQQQHSSAVGRVSFASPGGFAAGFQ